MSFYDGDDKVNLIRSQKIMINLTRLYNGLESASDSLRYPGKSGTPATRRKPVVVWTMTKRCNLSCVHCYADAGRGIYQGELTDKEARIMLEDLARFGVPALLLSGGEPLTHPHFFQLARTANDLGLRLTISTNGTLISEEKAEAIKKIGITYVGISFDGLGQINDLFRGQKGAFEAALKGLRSLKAVGQKVGLRFTLTQRNYAALNQIFEFVEQEKIDRVCFYHLVYSGRGSQMSKDDLTHEQTRHAIEQMLAWLTRLKEKNAPVEVLTVDNSVDGVYLYLKLRKENPGQAEEVRQLLGRNGGGANSSGLGIANIDSYGYVHPDQFWQNYSLGNIKEKPFSEIWADTASDSFLNQLRDRNQHLKGRCQTCYWKPLCGGSFRVRALQATGDLWAEDPACYLTNEEVLHCP